MKRTEKRTRGPTIIPARQKKTICGPFGLQTPGNPKKAQNFEPKGQGSWTWAVHRDPGCSSPPKSIGPADDWWASTSPVTVGLPDMLRSSTGDVADLEVHLTALGQTRFDVVLSDMAPATTGNRHVDEARSMGLCEAALYIAEKSSVPAADFVCKIFQGSDFKAFADQVKTFSPPNGLSAAKYDAKPAGRCSSSDWGENNVSVKKITGGIHVRTQ
jgi:hypothetical protein